MHFTAVVFVFYQNHNFFTVYSIMLFYFVRSFAQLALEKISAELRKSDIFFKIKQHCFAHIKKHLTKYIKYDKIFKIKL
jgi:hypothetical protein